MSSMVMFSVAYLSARTKSSGINLDTGVLHWTLGCVSSSTSIDNAAAVKDLEVLAQSKRVEGVTFSPDETATTP